MSSLLSKNNNRAFTLIELLVVISIIVILTGLVLTRLSPAKDRARDNQSVARVNQVVLSAEQYYNMCGEYPNTLDKAADNGCPSGTSFGNFLPKDNYTNIGYSAKDRNGKCKGIHVWVELKELESGTHTEADADFDSSGWGVCNESNQGQDLDNTTDPDDMYFDLVHPPYLAHQ
jgi:prepilin-type N-terminal cleavage/methylation domain-containing protein